MFVTAAMTANEQFRSRFRAIGIRVDDATPAFTGLYPYGGGYGNWELLFVRHRLLASYDKGIGVWIAYSGPTPTRLLATYSPDQLALLKRGRRRRYDQIALGSQKFWVHSSTRDVIDRWLAASK